MTGILPTEQTRGAPDQTAPAMQEGDRHRLPPLAHEAMTRHVPGIGQTAVYIAERLRK